MTTETAHETHADLHPHDANAHAHPSDWEYVKVGLFLALLTSAEISIYYWDPDFLIAAIGIGLLSAVKFTTVAMFFMHLRFDSKLFRAFFITGLILAFIVYTIVLSTFHFWNGGT